MTQTTRRLDLRDPNSLDVAVDLLDRGELVAMPTETVYGLCGDATNGQAVAAIFEAKGRPSFNPLICHVADLAMAARVADVSDDVAALAARFWPGPLTIVLPMRDESGLHPLVAAGLPTVALRMPAGPLRDVARRLDRPVAAPSANRSGRVSPTSADHVLRTLDGRIPLVVDGGATTHGLESTILGFGNEGVRVLRPGPIGADEIAATLGRTVAARAENDSINAPGQMTSHYAPHGSVRLNAMNAEPDECWIGFGPDPAGAETARHRANLSPAGDLREAASNLFAALSRFDGAEFERIAIAPIPMVGLGIAINDRLTRAAATR